MNVVLIHGMGRSPISMARLGRWLRRAGHRVDFFGYLAAVESFDGIARRLHERLLRLGAQGQPYVVIGHSLGGLIARAALSRTPPVAPRLVHLIMLGTPNRVPRLARHFGRLWAYRWLNGDSGAKLASAEYFQSLPVPSVPYTIIAGTGGRRGKLSVFGAEPNDGRVGVDETRLTTSDQPIELPVRHTFIMNNPQVRSAIQHVLETVAT